MGIILESIVPIKFLSCISHVLIVITLFWTYEQNVKSGLPSDYSNSDHLNAVISIILCVIVSLIMQVFEILVLFIGYSLFYDNINLIQTIFHCLGTILTSWFILDDWNYAGLWGIWFFTIFFPFTLEMVTLIKSNTSYHLKSV
jgi:Transmembrane protein